MSNRSDDIDSTGNESGRTPPAGSTGVPQSHDKAQPTLGLKSILREEVRPHERYAIIGGFGLIALQVYTMINGGAIHVVFPTAALVFFLYPFRKGIVTRRIMQLAIMTFLVWTFITLSGVLFPFIVAFIFSYLCSPLVSFLAKRGIPRWITSLAVVLLIVGVYSLIGFLIVPMFVSQFDQLLVAVKGIFEGAESINGDAMINWLQGYGFTHEQAAAVVRDYVEPQFASVGTTMVDWFDNFLSNIVAVIEGIANLILIPFLSFYMTVDFNRFRSFMRSTILRDDPRYVYYLGRVDTIVNAYVRGILLTSSMVGTLAVGTLTLFGVPYAIVLGVLTGVFNLIPTLGMFLNLGVAVLIFLVFPGDFWYNTFVMTGTIFALHALNANLIEPRVIGSRVGLHPVIVIASLFVFASYLGFVGLLIAVPATAVVLMFLKEWYRHTIQPESSSSAAPVAATASKQ